VIRVDVSVREVPEDADGVLELGMGELEATTEGDVAAEESEES